jgi:hypothetical protein
MALTNTPTPRDSNGGFLAMPREEELKTVEDFVQAIAYIHQHKLAKVTELNLLIKCKSQNIAALKKECANLKERVKEGVRNLVSIIVDLAVIDRSFTLQPNRLQFVICILPSNDLCLVANIY